MNYKNIVIVIAMVVMLLSPSVAGIISGGQASGKVGEVVTEKSDLKNITVELYITSTGEKQSMNIEEYVVGVMLAEVPYDYDGEALKAMAVAIRSHCLRRINRGEMCLEHLSAHVCDDYTHCMGYISHKEAEARWGSNRADVFYKTVDEAVLETKGEILTYEGQPADTVFHISSSGCTESALNYWGIETPYLISVPTPEAPEINRSIYSSMQLREVMERGVGEIVLSDSPEEWFGDTEWDNGGRVTFVNFGGKRVSGKRMKELLGLESTKFTVEWTEDNFVFETEGVGHGVGMSMAGSDFMAKTGLDHKSILNYYYPGTELDLY